MVNGFDYGLIKVVTECCPLRVTALTGWNARVGPLEPYRRAPEAALEYRRLFVKEHKLGTDEEEAELPHTCVRTRNLSLEEPCRKPARGHWLFG